MSKTQVETNYTGLETAVIGMSGRFPGARHIEEFWTHLKEGVESLVFFSGHELEEAGVGAEKLADPGYVKAAPRIADIDCFDAAFFGYGFKEAEQMDPQMRIFMECIWAALEDAGYLPGTSAGMIGLYAGAAGNISWEGRSWLAGSRSAAERFAQWYLSDKDFLSTGISYKLDLRGPSTTVYTACSTSLTAIHLAVRALLSGECKIACAGGITVGAKAKTGYLYQEGMIMSPDGHCRAFDARARGTVFGEGAGVVVLKRLKTALADNDHIYAVIRGSAINNDGNRKVGFTAPSVEGQSEVIRMAQRLARVEPESITYVETHGTGTALGDPVEIEGLKLAFNTDKRNFCAIGSVKTNFGHLDVAAGVAGFIKTVLALTHRMIPPSLHFESANPKIDFRDTPFYVNTRLVEWQNERYPLRAGVSSFGIGGTNAHVVLEEAPPVVTAENKQAREDQFILLSAKTQPALERMKENLVDYFKKNPGINSADAAYTLQVGRRSFKYRQMAVCKDAAEAIRALESPQRLYQGTASEEGPPLVFMFPGQGAQYVGMGRELVQKEPVFREEMERCFAILKPVMGMDLKGVLYPDAATGTVGQPSHPSPGADSNLLKQTAIAQPLLFVFEYALARLLLHWGITPYAMIGHSIGEYVAACLAGVFSLEDALRLVALRGGLMQQTREGTMVGVPLAEEALRPLLGQEVSLAAVNGPSHCVISGRAGAVDVLVEQLKANGHECTPLHTSHAFHSSLMDPVLEVFREAVARVALNPPTIPYISNLSGDWLNAAEVMDPGYWIAHLRQPVRFYHGLTRLLEKEGTVFLEVGPGRALSTLVRKHPRRQPHQPVLNLVRHPRENRPDTRYLSEQVGQLWLHGIQPDWSRFAEPGQRRRVSLPTYPFEKQRFTAEADLAGKFGEAFTGISPAGAAGKKSDPAQWFYIPSWKRTLPPEAQKTAASPGPEHSTWLFFLDNNGIGKQLPAHVVPAGQQAVTVRVGTAFAGPEAGEHDYLLNPARPGDYRALLAGLQVRGIVPRRIVHLWNVTGPDPTGPGAAAGPEVSDVEPQLEQGFYSLLYLAQALGETYADENLRLYVVSAGVQEAGGEERLNPLKAALLGPAAVIPLEYPHLSCTCIDILPPPPGSRQEETLIRQLAAELQAESTEAVIAYRHHHRLVRTYEPVRLPGGTSSPLTRLKEKGVYLLTGGLGGIGLTLAQHLAKRVKARLVLTRRSPFPPPGEWDAWLSLHPEPDPVSRLIRQLRHLEDLGAEIMACRADVTDYRAMQAVLSRARDRWGTVNGVIHCAGIPGGGLVQPKTREQAAAVLDAKINGTLVLNRVLKDLDLEPHLDFLVLCSSINSVVPLLGQADYYAANAFLDAFAFYRQALGGPFTVSINWDTWQEVGMAKEAALRAFGARETHHPLVQYHLPAGEHDIYLSRLGFQSHWVLNEHRTPDKKGLVPGTAYLEMVREAFQPHASGGIEIRDVQFLTPLVVAEGEETEVAVILKKEAEGSEFMVISRSPRQGDSEPVQRTHAVGRVRESHDRGPGLQDIKRLEALCGQGEILRGQRENSGPRQSGLLIFGPRWRNLKRIKYGENQALAVLELDSAYSGDLNRYKLHPALLDTATAFLYGHVEPRKAYIPYAYKGLILFKEMPARILSWCRWLEGKNPGPEFLTFNITIMDETGAPVAEIEEFTMMEVSEAVKARITGAISRTPGVEAGETRGENAALFETGIFDLWDRQAEFLKNGLLPEEGAEVLERILAGPASLAQVAISTVDLAARLRGAASGGRVLNAGMLKRATHSSLPTGPRPEIRSVYVAAKTPEERAIAGLWQDILGIDKIGIHDDFFELGGDSLNIVQLNALLKKELKRDIPMPVLFRYLTVHSFIHDYLNREEPGIGETDRQRVRSEVIKKGKDRLRTRISRSTRISNK